MDHISLSPAKINLFLKVLSRRPDGYHNIASMVEPISLYDIIHITEDAGDRVIVEDDRGLLPQGQENTVYRAIMLVKERFKVALGVKVFIEKRIPVGAGLGGGSGNAATVMKELVRLWRLSASLPELMEMGKEIGADVPLFLYGKPCIMRGIGDKISPCELPLLWYLIVYPNFFLSTKEVYGRLKIVLTKGENEGKVCAKYTTAHDVAFGLENDLEEVAIAIHPEIRSIKERLKQAGAIGSLMSGSGSSVFGIFADQEGAQKGLPSVKDLGNVFIAHSL
jgi:4-diphosphocytidyl-2-C-methyl-D-erythritol kinase